MKIVFGFHDHGWRNGEPVYWGNDLLEARRVCGELKRDGKFKCFGEPYQLQFVPFAPQAVAPIATEPEPKASKTTKAKSQ